MNREQAARTGTSVLATNFVLPRHPEKTETFTLEILGIPRVKLATLEQIDDAQANAYAAWTKLGSPKSLSPAIVSQLEKASELIKKPIEVQWKDQVALISLTLPPQGTALVTLEIE